MDTFILFYVGVFWLLLLVYLIWLIRHYLFVFVLFVDRFSLYNLGWPGIDYVDQAGLELRERSACLYFMSTRIKSMHHPASLNT